MAGTLAEMMPLRLPCEALGLLGGCLGHVRQGTGGNQGWIFWYSAWMRSGAPLPDAGNALPLALTDRLPARDHGASGALL